MSDIFKDIPKVVDNNKESAKNLGLDVPKTQKVKKTVFYASNKCNMCFGRGYKIMAFPGNKGDMQRSRVRCHCVFSKDIEIEEVIPS